MSILFCKIIEKIIEVRKESEHLLTAFLRSNQNEIMIYKILRIQIMAQVDYNTLET